MKKIIFFFAIIFFNFSNSQSVLTVKDAENNALLSGVLVKCNDQILGRTNQSGQLETKTKCNTLKISLSGYYPETVLLQKNMNADLTKVDSKMQSIETVVLKDESDPKALAVLNKVNDNYENNSPKSLDSYTFRSYEKFSMDIDEDSIQNYNQSLKDARKNAEKLPPARTEKKKDSVPDIAKIFSKSKLFLWERAQEFLYSKKYGEKVNILDSRVSGLSDPIYELLVIRNNRNKIPKEAKKENRDLYRYFLTDSLEIDGRQTYKISFREAFNKNKLKKNKFSGYMYIDKATYGIKQLSNFRKVASEGSISSVWNLIDDKWFLDSETVRVSIGSVDLNDQNSEEKKDDKRSKETVKAEKKERSTEEKYAMYGFVTSKYFDFKTNIPQDPKNFKGYTYSVENSDGSLLKDYRTEELTDREKDTYKIIDSVGSQYGVQRKAKIFSSLLHGKIRFGMFDFDAGSILGYNQYEGIRLGINAKLNEKFNKYISPDAYVAYGFKDRGFKYGVGLDVKTTLDKVSFFRLEYFDDVNPAGKFNENFWNFRMKLANSGISLKNDRFYNFKGGRFAYEQDLSNSLSANISTAYINESALFAYNYKNLGNEFTNVSARLSVKYAPFSRNIMTPAGKYTTEEKFPDLFANIEQGFETLGGDFSYTKVDILFNHQFTTKFGQTGIRIYGGKLFGNAPIWHNFTMNGLSGGNGLNLNLASYLGFATMKGGKYYNDEFAGQYLSHSIPWKFRTIGKGYSNFNVLYRSIIGNMKDPQFHDLEFQKLDHLYQEVGVEVENFLSTRFNLGFFYRVGHYRTEKFSDNFAIQFKLKLLGF